MIVTLLKTSILLEANAQAAVAMSAMVQFRTLGGALGLAIVTTVFTAFVKLKLANASFTSVEIGALLQTLGLFEILTEEKANFARTVFAEGYNLQMKIVAGVSAAQVLAATLLWKQPCYPSD